MRRLPAVVAKAGKNNARPQDGPLQKHKDIQLLKAGHAVRNAAKITCKGNPTVQRVKRLIAISQ
jgi:hypothetical protein